MFRPLEPRSDKFRECSILLRTSGYPGSRALVALTIDPLRGKVWFTDGTPEGTSLPKAPTTEWSWFLIDLDGGCCYKGTKPEVLRALSQCGPKGSAANCFRESA